MGCHSVLHATKLDSHANMAVAGSDCTVIATSGRHATVTPFSSNLPTMYVVEIGDVAIAYDDPIFSSNVPVSDEECIADSNNGSQFDNTVLDTVGWSPSR